VHQGRGGGAFDLEGRGVAGFSEPSGKKSGFIWNPETEKGEEPCRGGKEGNIYFL